MNYSSGSIKEVYLDASNMTQSRCVFKLSGEVNYLSNMKLTNIGAICPGGATNYNRSAGVLGLIRNISLQDGATVLSQSREANLDAALKNLLGENDNNISVKTGLNFGRRGFVFGQYPDPAGAANTLQTGYSSVGHGANEIDTTEANSAKGTVVLSDLLPILKVLPMLDTAVFKDGLQLVVEWESDIRKIATSVTNPVTVVQPILCAYEVSDPMLYAQLSVKAGNVSWVEREVDQRPYAASASLVQRFNGFDNKHLMRLCIVKQLQNLDLYRVGTSIQGMGPLSSLALSSEEYNIVNQGRRLFPRDIGNFDIARQTLNAFGDSSMVNGGIQSAGVDAASSPNYALNLNSQPGDFVNAFLMPSEAGYNGCLMGNVPVRNLEISLSRDLSNIDGKQNAALNVFLFGDVPKVMSVAKDGSYLISYV